MRTEPSYNQDTPNTPPSSHEGRSTLQKLSEYAQDLSISLNRKLEEVGAKFTGIDPTLLERAYDAHKPNDTTSGANDRIFIPQAPTSEGQHRARSAEAVRSVKTAQIRLAKAMGLVAALAGGGLMIAPTAHRLGEAQGAIDALNDGSTNPSIGRLLRDAKAIGNSAINEAATQTDHIRRQYGITDTPTEVQDEETHVAELGATSPEERAALDRISKFTHEIAKRLFQEWQRTADKDGHHGAANLDGYHRSFHSYASSPENIFTVIKTQIPELQNTPALSSTLLRTEVFNAIQREAHRAHEQAATHALHNLRTNSLGREVHDTLRQFELDKPEDYGRVSGLLLEAGKTRLAAQFLRLAVQNARLELTQDERNNTNVDNPPKFDELLALDDIAPRQEGAERRGERTVAERIAADVFQPIVEEHAIALAHHLNQLHLRREEERMLLVAVDTLLDKNSASLERDDEFLSNQVAAHVLTPDRLRTPASDEIVPSSPRDGARWDMYQADLQIYKDLSVLRTRLHPSTAQPHFILDPLPTTPLNLTVTPQHAPVENIRIIQNSTPIQQEPYTHTSRP